MVLTDPGGHPVDGVNNWSSGWMPPLFQGTVLRPKEPRILNLDPPAQLRGDLQRQNLDLLRELNRAHLERHPGEADLEARIASYELAAAMQTAAKEALDVSQESAATHRLYGLDDPATKEYGTRCLIARRLVERGVRFVQLFLGGQPWDNHNNIRGTLPEICRRTDKPAAALVRDLKQRGMLDTTLVHWGGEIGRLPVVEGTGDSVGRDHNGQGFSTWLAGGGIRPGMTYGETDEFGHKAVKDVVNHFDYHATLPVWTIPTLVMRFTLARATPGVSLDWRWTQALHAAQVIPEARTPVGSRHPDRHVIAHQAVPRPCISLLNGGACQRVLPRRRLRGRVQPIRDDRTPAPWTMPPRGCRQRRGLQDIMRCVT